MDLINIGKYINTHGIKGEIRILSNFSRKDLVFIPDNKIYIKKKEYIINTYRKHKNYDMVTLKGIDSINDIENLKNSDVYFSKDDLKADYLVEDFITYNVVIKDNEYKIIDIIENKKNKILVLENKVMIPLVDEFVIKIDYKLKKIYIKEIEGLI